MRVCRRLVVFFLVALVKTLAVVAKVYFRDVTGAGEMSP